ncbi:MAG: exonuclease subunit SbcD [Actinobacteria bacterium]|nr:MAG: exonuclease subunit SbcD [Actinomycetota bacterium]
MRLLHTADWHVGRTIRGRSRTEEFSDALHEVVGIATQEGVDAVLVAGDLYDHRSPSPEAAPSPATTIRRSASKRWPGSSPGSGSRWSPGWFPPAGDRWWRCRPATGAGPL